MARRMRGPGRFAAVLLFAALACAAARAATLLPGFDDLERKLRLDPAQKAQYGAAVAATQRAVFSVGLAALQVKDRVAAELAKPKPDLDALARAQSEIIEQTRPLFRDARREWTRLYAMLDASQVAMARAFVDAKLRHLEDLARSLQGLWAPGHR